MITVLSKLFKYKSYPSLLSVFISLLFIYNINHISTITPMIFGELKINRILILAIPSMLLSTAFCYYMAAKYHEQKPFPHSTVTTTACHYPQDIVFRFVMLISSSILSLCLFTAFRWMQFKCKESGYHRTPPKYQYYLSQFSIFCYCIVLGTIDGKGIGKWHTPCAIIFFLLWVIGVLNLTVFLTKLRNWDTSTLSYLSIRVKQIIATYLAIVWIYCLYCLYVLPSQNNQDIYTVIVEWNSVAANLLWLLSFVFEWKNFRIAFSKQK